MSDYFLICGLGRLGQSCVLALKKFGVKVIAIQQKATDNWEIDNLPDLLEDLIIGDCRQTSVLKQAQIEQCRAALITTADEQVNIITALAIRQLNPPIRLVIRSDQENLNQLLGEQLGNVVAFEPTQLPAPAFALGGLGTDTLGFFTLDRQRLQVMQKMITLQDNWAYSRPLRELNTNNRRLIAHIPQGETFPQNFHAWEGQITASVGDTLIYVEKADKLVFLPSPPETLAKSSPRAWPKLIKKAWKNFFKMNFGQKVRKIAVLSGMIVVILLIIGTFLLHFYFAEEDKQGVLPWIYAFFTACLLLLGGYGDVFGPSPDGTPVWLRGFSLLSTLTGIAFVGILYALLTETLLASKFQFLKKRPPIPEKDHIVVIGLGRVGQKVATLLQDFKQSLVGVSFNTDLDRTILPQMPLIVANEQEALEQANLDRAKSILIVTDEDILNLEIALMARKLNPNSYLVVRASSQALGEALPKILPHANVVNPYLVSAAAFAGAAFGENIINIFQMNQQTILVTEYDIEADDTLNGLLLGEVAYGYGVVPLLLQKPPQPSGIMPSDDLQLAVGDRLIVLATTDGLQRIEKGRTTITPKTWRIRVETVANENAIFEGANTIARISGCTLAQARNLMENLPGVLSTPLYKPQADRLVRALGKSLVTADLIQI
jgi:Trk K+ transport system NAD-binding subunit